jgi:phenylpropionate dioxygenase-like ring-hydroxylating dioxygenase large terminal subunit
VISADKAEHHGVPLPRDRAQPRSPRNEDRGLRCVYDGWKYDVTGAVTDMPAEPPTSRLKERVRIKA